MKIVGSTLARRAAGAAALATFGVGAWEVQRRRDLRAARADPEWEELNTPLGGRAMSVVSTDGQRLHAEVFGAEDAPTIVLAHGWTCSIDFWHYQIRDLSRYFRVVAYDQRGHGRSDVPDEGAEYSPDLLASDLQAVLEACVPSGSRCVVAGHSMGGMTIVAWAGRHPELVSSRLAGALLVNTGMQELVTRLAVLGPLAGGAVHDALVPLMYTSQGLSARLEPIRLRAVHHVVAGPDVSPGRMAFMHRMVMSCPAPVRAGFGRLFGDLDLTESVQHLAVPTMVIAGEKDRLTPLWHAEQLAERLPDLVELTVLPRIGHMSPIEAPSDVTSRLRRLAADTLAPARTPLHVS